MKLKKVSHGLFPGVICFIFFSLSAHAGSPVWRVSLGESHLYLAGTIHILGESDYPLPQAFDRAYDNSHTLVFETDIQKSHDPEFGTYFLKKMVYPDNQTLDQLLLPKTFEDLKRFTAGRGIPIETILRFKPGLVLITLTLAEVERLGLDGTGVDEFYFRKAAQERKKTFYLESLEEQVVFIETLGKGQEDPFIAYLIKDLETLPHQLNRIKNAWRAGDTPELEKAVLTPLKNEFPHLYSAIYANRNAKWLPRIQTMVATPGVEFILVGAAHLAGDQGLLALLEAQGFTLKNQ